MYEIFTDTAVCTYPDLGFTNVAFLPRTTPYATFLPISDLIESWRNVGSNVWNLGDWAIEWCTGYTGPRMLRDKVGRLDCRGVRIQRLDGWVAFGRKVLQWTHGLSWCDG